MPVAPGFMPLKVTKRGVCQKLANLRRGSSKRSIRMRSGSAAWPASYFNGGNEGDMLINKDSNPPEEFIL